MSHYYSAHLRAGVGVCGGVDQREPVACPPLRPAVLVDPGAQRIDALRSGEGLSEGVAEPEPSERGVVVAQRTAQGLRRGERVGEGGWEGWEGWEGWDRRAPRGAQWAVSYGP